MASTVASTFLTSPSCQQLHTEDFRDPTRARVVVRSCLQDPGLWPAIGGHKCNGVALCPSGLYADMAALVAQHIWRGNRWQGAELPGINVSNMHVDKPIIAKYPHDGQPQWIEMEVVSDLPPSSSGDIIDATLNCYIRSIRADGTKLQDLAHCSVFFEWMPGWVGQWSNYNGLIKSKIENLHVRAQTETSGDVVLMQRERSYELFQSFVDYGPLYQNMAQVVCDNKTLEATAELAFQPDPKSDNTGPYYLDGSCHLSGFVCNAVEQDRDKNAYISHGWGAMKLSSGFRPAHGADIRSYVHMKPLPEDKNVLSGDVFVLQDNEIVGIWEGVQFKRIPRRVLNVFLPPPKKT